MPLTAQVIKSLVEASRRKDWAHKAGYRSLSTFPWHCWLLTPETNEVEESQPGALNLASGHWQPRSPCKKKRGATLYSDNVGQAKKGIFVGLMTQLPVIWIVDSEAVVAELVDAHVSGTCAFGCGSSSLPDRIITMTKWQLQQSRH